MTTRPVRCFVQGAQGTGKSTLIHAVSRDGIGQYSVQVVEDVARSLLEKGLSHSMGTRVEDYYAYYAERLKGYREIRADVVLFDRSILDVAAYSRILMGPGNWVERLGFEILELVRRDLTMIAYLPIEFPLVQDGVRDADIQSQARFDATLRTVMQELGLGYITITGDLEARKGELTRLLLHAIS